jgi:hypothetical protein
MSFRLQLLLVGLVVLAYLGARWWWLERKLEQKPASEADDDLQATSGLPLERLEPTMSNPIGLAQDDAVAGEVASLLTPSNSPEFADLSVAGIDRRPVLHPQIDCIAMLDMDEASTGEFALSHMPTTHRIGSKTWRVEGFNQATRAWEPVTAGQTYDYFQAGIQLVNRNGALNDVEFSEFVAKASHLAESLGASADFPEMISEVARAKELEQFTLAHDIRLSLNLHAKRAAWSFAYLQQHVQRAGFVAGVIPGRWVLGSSEHELIALTIDSQAAMADDVEAVPIRKLTLLLDVPQVARGAARSDGSVGKPFDAMCDVAIRLCAGMEAAIVDEQGLAVDVQALQRTASELEAVYDRLDNVGLSAGSALAKRLFS